MSHHPPCRILAAVLLATAGVANADDTPPPARVAVTADGAASAYDRMIFGGYLEHFGILISCSGAQDGTTIHPYLLEQAGAFNDIAQPDRFAQRQAELLFQNTTTTLPPHSLTIMTLADPSQKGRGKQ